MTSSSSSTQSIPPLNPNAPEQWTQYISNAVSQLDQRTRDLTNRGMLVRPPKPEYFHGLTKEHVDLWIFEIEQYFNVVGLVDPHRVPFAASFLRDTALTWWRSKQLAARQDHALAARLTHWNNFQQDLLAHFKPMNSARIARDKLHVLRQTGPMLQLISIFNTYCADIPNMTEDEKMDKFRRAVRPAIQHKLEIENPQTLFEMQSLAQRIDTVLWTYRGLHNKPNQPYRRNPDAMEVDAIEEEEEEDDEMKSSPDECEWGDETLNAIKHKPRTSKRFTKKTYKKKPNNYKPTNYKSNYNERVRCMQNGLCFKCKQKGHRIRDCPQWKHLKSKTQ